MKNLTYIIFGILFGIVLTKAEVISWFHIQDMFQFKELHMYLIIGSAVVVGAVFHSDHQSAEGESAQR